MEGWRERKEELGEGGYMYEDGRLTDGEEEGEGGRGDDGVGGGKE